MQKFIPLLRVTKKSRSIMHLVKEADPAILSKRFNQLLFCSLLVKLRKTKFIPSFFPCPGLPEVNKGVNSQALPRRRPRRTSGTLVPRRALPDETGKEEEDMQKGGDTLSQQLSRAEQGTADVNSNNQVPETIPTPPNQTPIPGMQPIGTVHSPVQNGEDQADITPQNETDPLAPFRCPAKDIRTKWFLEGNNCVEPKQNDPEGGVMVNGAVNSTCFKRPSLDSSSKSSEELDSTHLSPMEYPLKKRKSLSDSLLCTVPQDGEKLQSSHLPNGTSTEGGNVNNGQYIDAAKDKLSPSIERKQNFSKQNGSPFSHKKPSSSNGPCCKHSDEDINNQRNRTTTHPCYDPVELPKRRRNAACTVAILSPGDRSGSDDFLETKI